MLRGRKPLATNMAINLVIAVGLSAEDLQTIFGVVVFFFEEAGSS